MNTQEPNGTHVGLILALTVNGLAVSAYPEMVTVAQTAENYGFDSVWLCDHFLTVSPDDYVKDAGISAEAGESDRDARPKSLPLLECWTALTALARDTTRLRLGTSVLCNSYRHPSVLAKDGRHVGRHFGGTSRSGVRRQVVSTGVRSLWDSVPAVRDRVSAGRVTAAHKGRVDPAEPHLCWQFYR